MGSRTRPHIPRKKKFKLRYFRYPFNCAFFPRRMAQDDCKCIEGRAVIALRSHIEPLDELSGLPRRDLPSILRGQLTILRMRAKQGIPLSVECLERAERLAQILESEELAE